MKIKRFVAIDMREALRLVREQQGPEAVILSSRRTPEGLEVVSAVDYDETLIDSARPAQPKPDGATGHDDDVYSASPRPGSERFVDRLRRARTGQGLRSLPDDTVVPSRPAPAANDLGPAKRPAARRAAAPEKAPAAAVRSGRVSSPVDEHDVSSMRGEINALRRMLEGQLSSLAWHDFSRRSPVKAALLKDLLGLGLAPTLAQDLVNAGGEENAELGFAWRRALGELAQRIPVVDGDPVDDGGVVALFGPTGVGKTTTIAKLAARFARRHGPESVAIVSADDHRVGAQEQIFSYGRMLDVPVYPAGSNEELARRLDRLTQSRLVLIDTPGAACRNGALGRTIEIIESAGRGLLPYLVLAANAQLEAMVEALLVFRRVSLEGVIVTKIDEAASLGGVISALIEQRRPLAYAADGQEIPENLRRASARNLVRRAIELRSDHRPQADEATLAQQLGELRYAFG
jgi:flagellar biosynthesis protein FlhF